MKKFTFIFLLNLLVSSALLAQVSVGVKAGGALANIAESGVGWGTDNGSKTKNTYLLGAYLNLPLAAGLELQPEILYVNIGFEDSMFGEQNYYHYISLPLMLQYKLTDKLRVEAGPELSYLIDVGTNRSTISYRSYFKDLDMAVNVGLSYSPIEKLFIGLRYNLGVYDVSKDYTVTIGNNETITQSNSLYNRSLQLSVGFRLF